MKKLVFTSIVALALSAFSVSAIDIRGALGKLGSQSSQDSEGSSNSSALGGVLGLVGNIVLGTDVDLKDIQGDWKYVAPAVSFRSEDILKKAGGEVAAKAVEDKIKPYYEKVGITAMTFSVAEDSTFVMTVRGVTLKGDLVKEQDGNFTFKFKAVGRISIGSMKSFIVRDGSNIDITFDASKLMTLVSKIASISGNQTLGAASNLLNSYDGLNVGFEVARVAK